MIRKSQARNERNISKLTAEASNPRENRTVAALFNRKIEEIYDAPESACSEKEEQKEIWSEQRYFFKRLKNKMENEKKTSNIRSPLILELRNTCCGGVA